MFARHRRSHVRQPSASMLVPAVPVTLDDLAPGQRARIRGHRASGAVRQRLLDLGLLPNASVELVRRAPLNDPIQIKLESGHVALRRAEARQIDLGEPD